MGAIDYCRFHRLLQRSAELAAEIGMDASVVHAYKRALQPPAEVYLAAHEAVRRSEAAFRREHQEALTALVAGDAAYREARRIVLAFAPQAQLPESLTSLPTDMERLDAMDRLLDALDDHSGEAWADDLAQGAYGRRAAAAVLELTEASAANEALSCARDARARAYGPAHDAYVRWKRLLRAALGAHAPQYKRLHLRAEGAADEAAPVTVPEPAVHRALRGARAAPASDRPRGGVIKRLGGEDQPS